MSLFAKINESNIVLTVIVADQNFVDSQPGSWAPVDENGVNPKNYPGPGWTYDAVNGAYYPPQPYASWALDENFMWQPPTPRPEGGVMRVWNEANQVWDEQT